jgi:predicted dithiol-disulfide oxidoreductase (DUF899 family)
MWTDAERVCIREQTGSGPSTVKTTRLTPKQAPGGLARSTFQAQLDALRVREKARTREGDAIAAVRRRLPVVEIDSAIPLIGERGPVTLLDVFEGRRVFGGLCRPR